MTRTLILLGACLLLAAPASGQGADDAEPDLIDVERDEVVSETPPCKFKRPSDSWQFLDMAAMRARMAQEGQNPRSLDGVIARLWFGAARANIYVQHYPYASREPPELEALGRSHLESMKGVIAQAEVKGEGLTRMGKRPAYMFELEGTNRGNQEVLILEAITYRPEDNQVFIVMLEVPLAASQVKDVKKDFRKLIKKAKL